MRVAGGRVPEAPRSSRSSARGRLLPDAARSERLVGTAVLLGASRRATVSADRVPARRAWGIGAPACRSVAVRFSSLRRVVAGATERARASRVICARGGVRRGTAPARGRGASGCVPARCVEASSRPGVLGRCVSYPAISPPRSQRLLVPLIINDPGRLIMRRTLGFWLVSVNQTGGQPPCHPLLRWSG